MFQDVTGTLAKELERHPVTLVVVSCLIAFAVWSYTAFARADDISQIHSRIDGVANQYQVLEKSIARAGLESQIENIDREIFSLEREIEKIEIRGEDLPPLYGKRINELEILKEKKVRELDLLDSQIAARKSNSS